MGDPSEVPTPRDVVDQLDQWFSGGTDRRREAVLLTGFLAKGGRRGYRRLYQAPDLREFVEVHKEAILDHEPVTDSSLPSGTSLVWLDADAQLTQSTTSSDIVAAEFLTGKVLDNLPPDADVLTAPTPTPAVLWTITLTVTITITTTAPTGGENSRKCCTSPGSAISQCLCTGAGPDRPTCGQCFVAPQAGPEPV